MNRYNVIVGGILGLVGTFGGCHREESTNNLERKVEVVSEANQFLRGFPDMIPGISGVVKYEVPGADQAIVHIRQYHNISFQNLPSIVEPLNKINNGSEFSEKELREFNEAVNGVLLSHIDRVSDLQKNIAYCMIDLRDFYGVKDFRVEGYDINPDRELLLKSLVADCQALKRIFPTINLNLESNPGRFLYFGSEKVLGSQGKINVRKAEEAHLVEMAFEALNAEGHESDRFKKVVFDEREDALLNIVDSGEERFSFVVYGAEHDLRDNIDRWNSENPDNKFSLIVLTPTGVD